MYTNNKTQHIAFAELQGFVKTLTEADGEKIEGGLWHDPGNMQDPLNYKEWTPDYLKRLIRGPITR